MQILVVIYLKHFILSFLKTPLNSLRALESNWLKLKYGCVDVNFIIPAPTLAYRKVFPSLNYFGVKEKHLF